MKLHFEKESYTINDCAVKTGFYAANYASLVAAEEYLTEQEQGADILRRCLKRFPHFETIHVRFGDESIGSNFIIKSLDYVPGRRLNPFDFKGDKILSLLASALQDTGIKLKVFAIRDDAFNGRCAQPDLGKIRVLPSVECFRQSPSYNAIWLMLGRLTTPTVDAFQYLRQFTLNVRAGESVDDREQDYVCKRIKEILERMTFIEVLELGPLALTWQITLPSILPSSVKTYLRYLKLYLLSEGSKDFLLDYLGMHRETLQTVCLDLIDIEDSPGGLGRYDQMITRLRGYEFPALKAFKVNEDRKDRVSYTDRTVPYIRRETDVSPS